MDLLDDSIAVPHERVFVYHGEEEAVPQPHSFQFCPLGIQVYNRREVALYELVEFTMELPSDSGDPERISCTCLVVNCSYEEKSELYRIWMKFLDLPESACQRIHQLTRTSKYLCPFCENF